MTDQSRTVSVAEAARLLGVGRSTLFSAVARGESPLRAIRIGRRVVVPRAEVERVLGAQQEQKEA